MSSFLRILLVPALMILNNFYGRELRAAETGNPPDAAKELKSLTEKDYREFGQKLEEAVKKADKASVDKLVSVVALYERVLSDFKLSDEDRKSILDTVRRKNGRFLFDEIQDQVKKGGRYTFLRTRKVEEQQRVLMRMILENDSVNYHDLVLVRSPSGTVIVEDIYVFLTGEMFTRTIRRALITMLPEGNENVADQLKTVDRAFLKNVNEVHKMTNAIRSGQGKEALIIFRKLPIDLQEEKAFQMMAIKAAQDGDEKDYLIELERYRKAHPDDKAIDFISIDYYIIKKQYDEAIKATERVEQSLGGDPYLQILRGGILSMAGKNALAKTMIEKAIKEEPNLPNGYWSRASIALEEKNHADTLIWLKTIIEKEFADIDPDNLKTVDQYADFVKSPEFKKLKTWLAERKK